MYRPTENANLWVPSSAWLPRKMVPKIIFFSFCFSRLIVFYLFIFCSLPLEFFRSLLFLCHTRLVSVWPKCVAQKTRATKAEYSWTVWHLICFHCTLILPCSHCFTVFRLCSLKFTHIWYLLRSLKTHLFVHSRHVHTLAFYCQHLLDLFVLY